MPARRAIWPQHTVAPVPSARAGPGATARPFPAVLDATRVGGSEQGQAISRRDEVAADLFALELTGDLRAAAEPMRFNAPTLRYDHPEPHERLAAMRRHLEHGNAAGAIERMPQRRGDLG